MGAFRSPMRFPLYKWGLLNILSLYYRYSTKLHLITFFIHNINVLVTQFLSLKGKFFQDSDYRVNWKYLISLDMDLCYLIFSFVFLSIKQLYKGEMRKQLCGMIKEYFLKMLFFVLVYGRKVGRTVLFRGACNQGQTSIKMNLNKTSREIQEQKTTLPFP